MSDATVQIRPACSADVAALTEILALIPLGGPEAVVPLPEALAAFAAISAQQGRSLLVAEQSATILGSVDMLIVPNLTHDAQPFASVTNLVVTEDARRRGVGRALMQEVVQRARTAGCYKIEVISDRGRPEATLLYEEIGFHPISGGYRLFPV